MTFSINDLNKLTSLCYIENGIKVVLTKRGTDSLEINAFPCNYYINGEKIKTIDQEAATSNASTAINGNKKWWENKNEANKDCRATTTKYEIALDNFNKKLNVSKNNNG